MSNEETQVQPAAGEQDVDTGVDNESNDSSSEESSTDDRYENQKRRAEKAEAELKKLREQMKTSEPEKRETKTAADGADPYEIDRKVLLANGMEEDLLEELEKTARLNNTTLLAAQNDDYFKYKKQQFDEQKRLEAASVGASRGSGNRENPKDFSTPGLSKDDHKKMTQEAMKNLRF